MFKIIYHRDRRQSLIILLPVLLLLMTGSCQYPTAVNDFAQVSLKLKLPVSQSLQKMNTSATINRIIVTVWTGMPETESYSELVVKALTISDRSARGTVKVPMGSDLTFYVEAFDMNNILQYYGQTTASIAEKTFTITMELTSLPPASVNLDVSVNPITLSWTKSAAVDFASYKLYRSSTPGVTTLSNLIYSTSDNDSTTFIDTDPLSPGNYYYRVYVVDTENIMSNGSNEVKVSIIG